MLSKSVCPLGKKSQTLALVRTFPIFNGHRSFSYKGGLDEGCLIGCNLQRILPKYLKNIQVKYYVIKCNDMVYYKIMQRMFRAKLRFQMVYKSFFLFLYRRASIDLNISIQFIVYIVSRATSALAGILFLHYTFFFFSQITTVLHENLECKQCSCFGRYLHYIT